MDTVRALLDQAGRTYAEEAGIKLATNRPRSTSCSC
jgi:hypothetical protein